MYIHGKKPIDIPIEKSLKKYPVNALLENHVRAFFRHYTKNKIFPLQNFSVCVIKSAGNILFAWAVCWLLLFNFFSLFRTKLDIIGPKFHKLSVPRYKDLTLGIAKLESCLKL